MCRPAPVAGASIGTALVAAVGITATGYVVLSVAAFVIFVLTTALAVFAAGAALYVGFELLDLIPAWRNWRDGWGIESTILALRRTYQLVKVHSIRASSAPRGELPSVPHASITAGWHPAPGGDVAVGLHELNPVSWTTAAGRHELDPVSWAAAPLRARYPHLVLRADGGGSR